MPEGPSSWRTLPPTLHIPYTEDGRRTFRCLAGSNPGWHSSTLSTSVCSCSTPLLMKELNHQQAWSVSYVSSVFIDFKVFCKITRFLAIQKKHTLLDYFTLKFQVLILKSSLVHSHSTRPTYNKQTWFALSRLFVLL